MLFQAAVSVGVVGTLLSAEPLPTHRGLHREEGQAARKRRAVGPRNPRSGESGLWLVQVGDESQAPLGAGSAARDRHVPGLGTHVLEPRPYGGIRHELEPAL